MCVLNGSNQANLLKFHNNTLKNPCFKPLAQKEVYMASNVIVRSVSEERFTQVVETGKHQLYADEPESFGGSDRGPGPYEYLLAALGA
jgi:hypothetical protein